jgi:hypothetical protein
MRKLAGLILVCFTLLIIGCNLAPGRINQIGSSGGGSITPFNGNFGFTATSQVTSTVFVFGGALQAAANGSVTGTMHVSGSGCFNPQTDVVPFTGTISSAGAFTVTSTAVNTQVVNFTATISADGTSITAGTFTITGGCGTAEHGTLTGFEVTSMTASYTGNFTSGTTVISVVSSALTQATTANAQGQFPLTGTLLFSSSTCGLSSATIQSATAAGTLVNMVLAGNDGLSTITFSGQATDGTAKTIVGTFSISGVGTCGGFAGSASLSHP